MEKMVLRRIGWIGASLGLTTALVGCTNSLSDSDTTSSAGPGAASTSAGYLSSENGLNSINGLNSVNGLNSAN
ncbi:MAG TPA: hypothetical protein VK989_08210, partial [Polyangia bacterium]|nr:hypothetical protein [Polyangia bacterium]